MDHGSRIIGYEPLYRLRGGTEVLSKSEDHMRGQDVMAESKGSKKPERTQGPKMAWMSAL